MNRYSPHYDHDEGTLSMGLDGEGGWVHINSVDARAVKKLEKEVAYLQRQISTLRAWMAEYPNDKYTGAWWLAEFDRMTAQEKTS